MGDKKAKNTQIGIGEIDTIRDILLGSRLEEMEIEMKTLQHEVSNLRLDLGNSLKEIKTTVKQNGKNLRSDLLQKIVDLENRMVRGQERAIHRIKKDKLDHTNKLAKIFTKLGKEIKPSK